MSHMEHRTPVSMFEEAARTGKVFLAEVALREAVEMRRTTNLTAMGRVRELVHEALHAATFDERRECLQHAHDLLRRELEPPPVEQPRPKFTLIKGGKA